MRESITTDSYWDILILGVSFADGNMCIGSENENVNKNGNGNENKNVQQFMNMNYFDNTM
jgi:hypothetical protein